MEFFEFHTPHAAAPPRLVVAVAAAGVDAVVAADAAAAVAGEKGGDLGCGWGRGVR